MAGVLYFALNAMNGFEPVQVGNTILISMVSAVCFMTIMYFFNALLGKAGSFIMIVFMVLQLSGSAGTYLIEISGDFAAAIHCYVPFTYTVNAFRSAISGGRVFRMN
jgi:putative membrane protein